MVSNQCGSFPDLTKSCPGLWHPESGLLDPESLHDILNPWVIQLRSNCFDQSSFSGSKRESVRLMIQSNKNTIVKVAFPISAGSKVRNGTTSCEHIV